MNILIISGYFYPINTPRSFRTTELAKELYRLGHQVTVCIPNNSYDYSGFLKSYPITMEFIDIPPSENLLFTGNKIKVLYQKIINRVKSTYLQYPNIKYVKKIPSYLKDKEKYDAIISIAVPHPIHWGVARAIKKNKNISRVWIADCGDPFMLCKTDSFKKPFYFKFFEKSFCKLCDYITVPVESGKDGYYPEFRNKIKVIPQGFDFSDVKVIPTYTPNEIITFAYAGGFIPGIRDPRPVLDFLENCNIDFRFYIYTNEQTLLIPYKERLKEKLIISGYIDRTELIYKMSTYDFLLNIENGTSVQSPSKLIDYGLAKRPILSLCSQRIDKIKFKEFLNREYKNQLMLPNIQDYDIKKVTKSFINLIDEKLS